MIKLFFVLNDTIFKNMNKFIFILITISMYYIHIFGRNLYFSFLENVK
jgi:hypothetical protein